MIKVKYNLKSKVTGRTSAEEKKVLCEFRPGYLHPGVDVDDNTGNAYLLVSDEMTGSFCMLPITDVVRDTECTQGDLGMINRNIHSVECAVYRGEIKGSHPSYGSRD